MILIIDNFDSFVYNIYQYVAESNKNIKVIRNNELTLHQIQLLKPEKVILSPGPKTPSMAGISNEAIEFFFQKIPILGICLGHQCIAEVFNQKIETASTIRHGKVSTINIIENHPIFTNVPNRFNAIRYHSLSIPKSIKSIPDFNILARSEDDNEIMAIAHVKYPLIGIQFHPESILTDHGKQIIKNFLTI